MTLNIVENNGGKMVKIASQSVCPRCKGNLRFVVESEIKPRETIVRYLYVCDTCRYRHVNESIILRMDGDKLIVMRAPRAQYS
jgi:C4-type Zn-finger protein